MTSATEHQTSISADPSLPTVRIVREFDAPVSRVYRAHVDPELVRQWLGPRSIDMDITTWDMRTGGEYRYTALRDGMLASGMEVGVVEGYDALAELLAEQAGQ